MKGDNIDMEVWKDIKGYKGLYQVSDLGNIRNIKTNRILSISLCCGYPRVGLWKDNKTHNHQVHRLIAVAFIPNPSNCPCINHKDENRKNHNIDNLEWCTHKYNSNYGSFPDKCAIRFAKPIIQKTKSGEFIKIHKSAREAGRETGIEHSNMIKCTKGKLKTAGGFIWENVTGV